MSGRNNYKIERSKSTVIMLDINGELKDQYMLLCMLFDVKCITSRTKMEEPAYEPPEVAFTMPADYVYISSRTDVNTAKLIIESYHGNYKIITMEDLWRLGTNRGTIKEDWVKQKLEGVRKGETILDAGAGTCYYKKYCSHLKYISQDSGQFYPNVNVDIKGDITNINLPKGEVDAVLCTEVLQYVADPMAAIYEFHRLIAKGGKLFITVPFFLPMHCAPYYSFTGFSEFWFEQIFRKVGFRTDEISTIGNYYDLHVIEQLRVLPTVRVFCDSSNEWNYMEDIADGLLTMMRFARRSERADVLGHCGYMIEATRIQKIYKMKYIFCSSVAVYYIILTQEGIYCITEFGGRDEYG